MTDSWFKQHRRQVHLDFHMPEFPAEAMTRLDPEAMAERFQKAGVNLVAVFAKDHFGNAFYNTVAGHKHARLDRDFLGETVEACHRRGIRTLGYYSVAWDKHAWDHNPSWRVVDAAGKPVDADRPWSSVCLNSPYKDELMMRQIEEIAGYPVDGLFLDTPHAPGYRNVCQCSYCRRKWKTELNVDLPTDPPIPLRDRLVMRTVEQWLTELRAVLRRINPRLIVCMNTASQGHVNRRIRELCDAGVWESQPHGGDYLGHSFASRTARNDILDTQVMTVRFYQGWGDMTLKPTAQLCTEAAAMVANGMPVNIGDQVNVDGTLEPAAYDALGQAFDLAGRHEAALADAAPVRHALVLLPVPDPALPFHHGLYMQGSEGPGIGPWRGAHKMLVESHVQFDLAFSVLEDNLERWPLVILPEPGCYQPGMHARLRQYVEQGGTLLAVGRSLLESGRFMLEDVFGLRYIEPFAFSSMHFRAGETLTGPTAAAPWRTGAWTLSTPLASMPLQLRGQAFKVVCDGAQELAALHLPQSEHQPPVRAFRSPYSPATTARSPYPFATVHSFGKGRAIYIAASIFEIYWKTNHTWLRQFIDLLLRSAGPEAPCHIDAPSTVELNLVQQEHDLLLNLVRYGLGHQGAATAIAAIERPDPVYNVPCAVRASGVSKVIVEPEGTELTFEQRGPWCVFTVPRVEYLTVTRLVGGGAQATA